MSNATLPSFSTTTLTSTPRAPVALFAGWIGIVVVVAWLVVAGLVSSTDVHAVVGPLPFVVVGAAVALFAGVCWTSTRDIVDGPARVFGAVGMVLSSAWLTTSFANAFGMNHGADPWLLQIVETFHHARYGVGLVVIAVLIAVGAVVVGTPRELPWLVVLSLLCAVLPVFPGLRLALVWIAARVCARRATVDDVVAIVVVTALLLCVESRIFLDGYGDFYGDILAMPAAWPAPVVLVIVVVGTAIVRRFLPGPAPVVVAIAAASLLVPRESAVLGAALFVVLVTPVARAAIIGIVVVTVGVVVLQLALAWAMMSPGAVVVELGIAGAAIAFAGVDTPLNARAASR